MIMGTRSSGIERKSQVINFNAGLGLRMQPHHQQTPLTKTNVHVLDFESHKKISQPPPESLSHRHQQHTNTLPPSSSSSASNSGEDLLGGSIFSTTSNLRTCLLGSCNSTSTSTFRNCSCSGHGHIIRNNPCDAISDSVYTFPALQPANSLTLPFLNSGGIMTTSGESRAGFTASQWQELKTQTMIFKYMMASAPVPPELLLPITKNPPIPPLQRSNRNSDPEPWRCKRTDGKKWRCSRDVVPHQKYCERHSHKNRPRSRKPVELQAQHHHVNNNTNPQIRSTGDVNNNNNNKPYHRFHFDVQNQTKDSAPGVAPLFPNHLPSSTPLDHDQPRYLEWFMNGENIAVGNSNNGDWNQYMHNTKVGIRGDIDSSHGSSSSTTTPTTTCNRDVQLKQSHVLLYPYESTPTAQGFLAPRLTSFLDPNVQGHETRHFIDAWSDTAPSDDGIDVNGNVNVGSSLSLTMYGDSEGNQAAGASGFNFKPNWMNSHVDWMNSPPGGPLAEVLCLGSGGSARPGVCEASPLGCSSITITTASSRSSSKEDGQELNFIN